MKTIIGVKLSVEGMHYYLDASEKHGLSVKFLEYPHRHMFHIEVRVSVKHDNRDKEFLLLKREVIKYYTRNIIKKNSMHWIFTRCLVK